MKTPPNGRRQSASSIRHQARRCGSLTLCRNAGQSPSFWTILNTVFDGTSFVTSDNFNGDPNYTLFDYNAYDASTTVGTLETLGAHDQTNQTSFNWQSSWLGNFYLPPDSALIDAGNTTADQVGLYEFTTQTSQAEEGSSPVDIGYHYVALDGNGNPLETFTNNAPDYLVDANGNGLPDAWEYYWFGNYTNYASELDSRGQKLLSDFQNGTDPDIIQFSIVATNNYVNSANVPLELNVFGGVPVYQAILVDDANQADADWTACATTNLSVNIGLAQGWHNVWIGLRGFASDATQTWQCKQLKLDSTSPLLIVTNPAATTGSVPMIQLQGYCPKPLSAISYDLSNALGVVMNQPASVSDQYYDDSNGEFTTNYFECVDVPLTNGLNVITLHATDLAGNVTAQEFSYTVDYSSKSAPVVQMTWPQNGMNICGSSMALRGQVDDPTVTVTATVTDTSGDTSTVSGVVERNGRFWVENLPLYAGNNTVAITMYNVIQQTTVTTLHLTQSPLTPNSEVKKRSLCGKG